MSYFKSDYFQRDENSDLIRTNLKINILNTMASQYIVFSKKKYALIQSECYNLKCIIFYMYVHKVFN